MYQYTVTGIFVVETEAADTREARHQAEQNLKTADIKHCVIEVRKENDDAKETQKRQEAGKTVVQSQAD